MNLFELNKYPNLKKALRFYIDHEGDSEKEGHIPLFVYFFKQMYNEHDIDLDALFDWSEEISEDFWSWGHNSRWAHTGSMWIEDHLDECIELALDLANQYGDLVIPEEKGE